MKFCIPSKNIFLCLHKLISIAKKSVLHFHLIGKIMIFPPDYRRCGQQHYSDLTQRTKRVLSCPVFIIIKRPTRGATTFSKLGVRFFLEKCTQFGAVCYPTGPPPESYVKSWDVCPNFARCDFVAETNQTNMTDYAILGSSLVLVGCLAKRKQTIYGRL